MANESDGAEKDNWSKALPFNTKSAMIRCRGFLIKTVIVSFRFSG